MTTLTTCTPRRRHDPFDRVVSHFLGNSLLGQSDLTPSAWAPKSDVFADGDTYVLRFDIPGVSKEDIDISVHGGRLSVSGERKDSVETGEDSAVYRRESFRGKFSRSFKLPTDADATSVAASHRDGVLEVRVQKKEEVKARKIDIAAA